jgi:predicted nucleic acid-binding protein
MNVVDSSGWIEYFADDVNADFFTAPIRDAENLLVPAICAYEVFKGVALERREEDAPRAIGILSLDKEVDLNREIAISAAQISLELKLVMADSIIYATVRAHKATLWTQDEHFKDLPGVRYIKKQTI